MSMYAEITNNVCTNVVVCDDPDFAAAQGWVGPLDDLTPQPGISWSYDGTNWTAPARPSTSAASAIPQAVTDALTTVTAAITPGQTSPSQEQLNQAFATLALAVAPTLGASS